MSSTHYQYWIGSPANPAWSPFQEALTWALRAITGILRWLDDVDSIGCYSVLNNIDTAEEPWHELVGTQEQGILYEKVPLPCENALLTATVKPVTTTNIGPY